MNNILPDCLTELKDKGIYLQDKLGVNNFAWTYQQAKDVLQCLTGNGYVIHGGDVLKNSKGHMEFANDFWGFEEETNKNKEENIKNSYEKSINYIDWYHNKFGDEFLYVIVFKKLL